MTNNFTSRQMEHIVALTAELQDASSSAFLQTTFSFHVTQTQQMDALHSQGFGDILKTLPSQKLKSFLEGLERIRERADSLTELLVLAQKQNEQRKANERLAAERATSERRIRELEAENTRLRKALRKKRDPRHSPSASENLDIDEIHFASSSPHSEPLAYEHLDLVGSRGSSDASSSRRLTPTSELKREDVLNSCGKRTLFGDDIRSGAGIVQGGLSGRQPSADPNEAAAMDRTASDALIHYEAQKPVIHKSEIQRGRSSDQEAGHGESCSFRRRSRNRSIGMLVISDIHMTSSQSRSRSRSLHRPCGDPAAALCVSTTPGHNRPFTGAFATYATGGYLPSRHDNYEKWSEIYDDSEPDTQPLHLNEGLLEAEENLIKNRDNLRALSETLHGLLLDGQEVMMAKKEVEEQIVC